MWHYHKQIHAPIPHGTTCGHGCYQLAQYRNTSGKYTCTKISQQCPAYKLKQSEQTTIWWAEDLKSAERKNQQSKRAKAYTTKQREQQLIKQKKTKQKKLLSIADTFEKRQYSRIVIYHSRNTYELHKEKLNPHNLIISRNEYHLDHKVSRHVGFLLNIPIQYMYSIHNLCLLRSKQNASKSIKCSLHPTHLLKLCKASEREINRVTENIKRLEGIELLLEST